MNDTTGTVVVGGGLYGVALALHAARRRDGRVVLVEREERLLRVASRSNQARVHMGYHYPRSFLTAIRSRRHYARFLEAHRDCIDTAVEAYYAIARSFSKVSARQFAEFCHRIGAPLSRAPAEVRALFDADRIEDVFRVEEASFDADRLAARLEADLHAAGVELRLGVEARRCRPRGGGWEVALSGPGGDDVLMAARVLNCTYAELNQLPGSAGLAPVPLKHELAELVVVEPPPELEGRAVTVMCGPFFSLTPLPAEGHHVLSHVRYTPHAAWHTGDAVPVGWGGGSLARQHEPASRFAAMVADASRYLPCMAGTVRRRSLWAVKTVLPRNEVDDGRPILVHHDPEAPGLVSVMGSKIDNVYDVLELLDAPTGVGAGAASC